MAAPTRANLALAAVTTLSVVVSCCVLLLVLRGRSVEVLYGLWIVLNAPAALLAVWIAYAVLRRFPGHGSGRILLAMGLLSAAHVLVATAADLRLVAAGVDQPINADLGLVPADLPLDASVPLLVMNVLWVPAALLAVLLLAYFPEGRLRGRGWRWVPVTATAAVIVLSVASVIDAWPTADWLDSEGPAVLGPLFAVGGLLSLAVLAGGVTSFVQRWRDSRAERRRFEVVGGFLCTAAVLGVVTYPWPRVWTPLVHVAFALVLLTYGTAISRYRLHEVEPLIGKSLVVATVSVLAVAAYLALVVGAGRALGLRSTDPLLPVLTVAVIAALAEPARRLVRRVVDRMAYGERAAPADVLAHLAEAGPGGRAATEVADLVMRATGASQVELELDGQGPAVVVGQPSDAPVRARAMVSGGQGRGGEIRVRAHAAGDLAPGTTSLLHDVAQLLSLLRENDRLTRSLAAELDRSRAARQRLVEAQEQTRRDLERDLHDGAQARLIAVAMRVGEVRRQVDLGRTGDLGDDLERVAAELDAAIRQLRDLARGVRPPVLDQSGVGAALRSHFRSTVLPVTVVEVGDTRYPPAVESAAYFACLEAVQNALRHGGGQVAVALSCGPEELCFTVSDEGADHAGPDPRGTGLVGIHDRVGAWGGTVSVWQGPGRGTRVEARIPASSSRVAEVQPPSAAR